MIFLEYGNWKLVNTQKWCLEILVMVWTMGHERKENIIVILKNDPLKQVLIKTEKYRLNP